MLVSLTVGKVDAGVTVLLTPDKRLIEFPSILLPPDISSGSIVDITVGQNKASETEAQRSFQALQEHIYASFGAAEPAAPVLRCRNATQTSVVLEWDPVELATADLVSLSLYRNGQKAGAIPRPTAMHSTKISGLAVDTEYTFHLVLRTTAGTYASERVAVRTHKMTDLSGVTVSTGVLPGAVRDSLSEAVARIGAKIVEGVRIDTTHFVTTEGRGQAWEKAVEMNIPVVRPEWVDACEKNGRILGVTKFYLDAMRPGPEDDQPPRAAPAPAPAESSTPPAPPPKTPDEPEKPAPPPKDEQQQEESKKDDKEESEEEEEEEEEEQAEKLDEEKKEQQEENKAASPDEQKTKSAQEQDEQKVRLQDKDDKPAESKPAADEDEEETDEEDAKKEAAEAKDKPTPDGASFQDVAL